MSSELFYVRHHSEDINFDGLEWVSEELFNRCYNRAIELYSRRGIDISVYHGVIIASVCNTLRNSKDKSTPYTYFSTVMANKVRNFKEDINNVESFETLRNELYIEDAYNCDKLDVGAVMRYVKNFVGQRNYDIWCDYMFCDYSATELGRSKYNLSHSRILEIVHKCNRYAIRYLLFIGRI